MKLRSNSLLSFAVLSVLVWSLLAQTPAARAQTIAGLVAVNTIAALRSVSHLSYQSVTVTGWHAVLDGGGGFYTYDSSDSTSLDNGGTIIVARDNARWKLTQSEPPSITQFGAVRGNSGVDNAPYIQKALNACTVLRVPPGLYRCNGPLLLNSQNVLQGLGATGEADDTSATMGAKFLFYGSGDACIGTSSSTPLSYAALKDLAVYVDPSASYSWIIHCYQPVGLALENLLLESAGLAIGGIRCQTFSGGVSNGNHVIRVVVQLPGYPGSGTPPAATAPTFDADFTDSQILSSSFIGGIGLVLRGPGNIGFAADTFDQSVGYNVTILHDQAGTTSGDGFANCSFLNCVSGEIFANLDAEDSDVPNVYPRFVGNTVWAPTVSYPLVTEQNASGPAPTQAGVFGGNSFTANPSAVYSLPSAGIGWTLAHNKYLAVPDFSSLTSATIDEDGVLSIPSAVFHGPIKVLGQSGEETDLTGTIYESQLGSVLVPASILGANGKLRISATFSVSSSSGAKTAFIRFGNGLLGQAFYQGTVSGSSTLIHAVCDISMAGATNAEVSAHGLIETGPGTATDNVVTGTVDTTAAQIVSFSGQLASSTDTISLIQYTVELLRP